MREESQWPGERLEVARVTGSDLMSSTSGDGTEWGIAARIERLEEIAETLEDGDIGLETAKELRKEADEHLETLREELDVGDGEIIEMDAEDADLDEE